MVLHNSILLTVLHDEAGWRPGDDPAPIYRRFAVRLRDLAANEDEMPHVRQEAHDDLVAIHSRGLAA